METKINIAAILKDKPQGTKLYDWLHNIDVELDTISTTDTETVVWCTNETNNNTTCHRGYSEFGTERGYPDGLQILFPSKEMRDWTKFSWKKGDVLANGEGDYCVFKEFAHSSYQTSKAVFVKHNKESIHSDSCLLNTKDWHKASHSCTATYINTIEKELSGKLNMETLEIEKAQPEFKDGDIAFADFGNTQDVFIVSGKTNLSEGYYSFIALNLNSTKALNIGYKKKFFKENLSTIRLATEEEKQQLFDALAKEGKAWDAGKKEVVDLKPKVKLKPFDKVLIRDFENQAWQVSLFSYKDRDSYYCCNGCGWNHCIPYIGNESLLGTTKDVEG